MSEDIAAPAVHTERWKRWSFGEGRERARRYIPEGIGLTNENGEMQLWDPNTKRVYALPEWDPDARDWHEANAELLFQIKTGRGRFVASAASADVPATQDGGTQNYIGNYASAVTSTIPGTFVRRINGVLTPYTKSPMTKFESFYGVEFAQSSFNTAILYSWVGIQGVIPNSFNGNLFQPIIRFDPPNLWQSTAQVYPFTQTRGTVGELSSKPEPLAAGVGPGIGIWGVVAYYGCTKQWVIQNYAGTPTTGPRLARPLGTGILMPDSSGTATQYGVMDVATVSCEIGGTLSSDHTYNCSDVSVTSVFGGLRLYFGNKLIPVNWTLYQNPSGPYRPFTCFQQNSIANPTANPNAQVTLSTYPQVGP